MNSYISLGIATLLPVVAAALFFLLDKKTAFGSLNEKIKQLIYGVAFGALAVIGTEWGIPMNGAQVNCRDASVLIGGLMFGAPAGIIAGVIGGVERWVAVAWGVGSYTRVACSVSTLIAGVYSAALRKYLFEDSKPGWFISFAIGVVMEVFHLTMVFVTNMDTPQKAMTVIRACTPPMVTANGLAVLLAAILLAALSGELGNERRKTSVRISQTVQRWLLLTVVFAFLVTTFFVFRLQSAIADTQAENLLTLAIDETAEDIVDASNSKLLDIANQIAPKCSAESADALAAEFNMAEINIFDNNGVVVGSNYPEYLGIRAADYPMIAEFLCLLDDETEYIQAQRESDIAIEGKEGEQLKYVGVRLTDGFLQIGCDAEKFQDYINAEVIGITKNRHVGETGYVLILNDKSELISAPKDMTDARFLQAGEIVNTHQPDTVVPITLGGEKILCCYRVAEGYDIISVLPKAEALQLRDIALYVNVYLEILVFALLFGLIYMLIKKVVVNQIMDINRSLAKITDGDLDETVNVRSNEEFASLSDDINATVDTLKNYISEAEARIDAELEFAKNIQVSALPNIFPAFPKRKDFDIFASMNPAKEVGGDFYDFYMTGSNTLNFLIADVSGKGIPAAMFMMRAKTELKTLTEMDADIADVFTMGNKALCEGNDAGMFVTAWQGSIDLETGLLRYANAGHNPPVLRRAGGSFEYLHSKVGFVLAGMDGVKYRRQEIQMQPGDILYLYTDGVTEATNAEVQLYGEDNLLKAMNSCEFESMKELCTFIKADVDAFVGEAPQFDDITMVAFKFIGQPPV